MTYEYANEIAFNTGRNSGLKYNYCPGSSQCYHTNPDKEHLSQLIEDIAFELQCGTWSPSPQLSNYDMLVTTISFSLILLEY